MKRLSIFTVIVTMIGLGLGSCNVFSRKAEIKTDIDSLSFYYGMARTEGFMNYLVFQAGIDTNYLEAFYKGFRDGAKNYGPKEIAYMEGKRIAQLINNQWVTNLNNEIFLGDKEQTVNRWALLSGFYSGVKNQDDMTLLHAQSFSNMKMEAVKETYIKIKFGEMIAAGEKLLAENKNNPAIKTTASGLQYRIMKEGTGQIPTDMARVKVHYRGKLVDGTEFDSSYKSDTPSTFHINGVITGWTEALKMMPTGSKWELFIPYNLGYGTTGQPPSIPPYATLIFEVELLEIESN